jgi:CRISPR-associated protein Cas1
MMAYCQMFFLKRLMNARPGKQELFSPAVSIIDRTLSGLDLKDAALENTRNRIMGLEGTAGRAYFQCLSKILPEKYQFPGRSRRPTKDPLNAVLNYCYDILYSQVEKACIILLAEAGEKRPERIAFIFFPFAKRISGG